MTVRYKEVRQDEIRPFRKKRVSRLSRPDLFHGADILGRADGLFVARICVACDFPTEDEDEVRFAVSMAAKVSLGHRHDVHRSKDEKNRLDPGEILVFSPVAVTEAQWEPAFQTRTFTNTHLRRADSIPEKLPADADPNELPRNALVCLRRRYLRVFEDLQSEIQEQRDDQVQWQTNPERIGTLVWAFLLTAIFYAAFLGVPTSLPKTLNDQIWAFASFCLLLGCTAVFLYEAVQMYKWDLPRIRLLRMAEVFYHYANPVNDVIRVVMRRKTGYRDAVTDFSSLSSLLAVKTAGETHRVGLRQLLMTMTLAVVSIYFAAAAIRSAAADVGEPLTGEFAGFDCGNGAPRTIGPFERGEWEVLAAGAQAPTDVLTALVGEHGGRNAGVILLLGSTDTESVRRLSPIESNSELARRRAAWVAGEMRETEAGRRTLIYTMNDTARFVRVELEPGPLTTGREVIVCVTR